MELIVNPAELFAEIPARLCSASQAELGSEAGNITWKNCQLLADKFDLGERFDHDDACDHFRAYGAWDASEIEGWSTRDVRAMCIQEIAADYRYQTEHDDRQDDVRHNLAGDGLMYCYFGT